jgi:Tfp pilus assembly PilM family ATPase
LTSPKEITSTERLLDVIRNEQQSDIPKKRPVFLPPGKSTTLSFFNALSPGKAHSVGVDIGYHNLRLIRVEKTRDQKWRLVDYRSVPLRADTHSGTPEFANILKAQLDSFCGASKRVRLWANMSSARVEVASIRVPKVSKKHFDVKGEVVEDGVTKLAVMVYAAPRKEVADIDALFTRIGYTLDGLTIAPFGIQNLFNTGWMPSAEESVSALYIGRGWSRIDIFSQGTLVMTRGIRAGINSMIQELMEGYNEGVGHADVDHLHGESNTVTDKDYMDMEEARELLIGLSPDSPSTEEIRHRFGLDEDAIMALIKPALERLVRQIDRTFRYYTVTLGNERIRAVYVSTAINVYKPFTDYIGDDLGVARDILDPFDPENPSAGRAASALSLSDRVAFGPALGVALSDSSTTPNLLFTYKDKKRQSNIEKGNRAIFLVLTITLIICVGILFSFGNIADRKQAILAGLENQMRQGVHVDEKVIPLFVSKIESDQEYIKQYSNRYLSVAMISELSSLTPSNICILHITARMDDPSTNAGKKKKGLVAVEGVVSGDPNTLEDKLVEYVLKLQSSPMFGQAKIQKSKVETLENNELLRFTLNVRFI